jgi:hypothetical protein
MAQRLLALNPLHEGAHASLMQLYARQGRRDSALQQYRLFADRSGTITQPAVACCAPDLDLTNGPHRMCLSLLGGSTMPAVLKATEKRSAHGALGQQRICASHVPCWTVIETKPFLGTTQTRWAQ